MKENAMDPYNDLALREVQSFLLYKNGKEPLNGQDPGSRIRKGIWRDEGVDLTAFNRSNGYSQDPEVASVILEMSKKTIREGVLRRKKDHIVASGLKDLSTMASSFEPEGFKIGDLQSFFLGSDILYPFALNRSFPPLDRSMGTIKVMRRHQRTPMDLDPTRILKRDEVHAVGRNQGEDILRIFKKTSDRKNAIHTPSGMIIGDLPGLIEHIFSCDEKDLSGFIEKDSLAIFAVEGLGSQLLASLLRDLSSGPGGEMESPGGFRERFGRWILESTLGEEVSDSIVPRLLKRLANCSEGEAMKLEEALQGLIGPGSTRELTSLVFSADPIKRPHIIRLLGRTRDRAAQETLKRLMDYSTLEADRTTAREALISMGVNPDG